MVNTGWNVEPLSFVRCQIETNNLFADKLNMI